MRIEHSAASQPEATEMVITGMDPKLYHAAFEGNMDAFKQVQDIKLQLTPNKNTVLHVHFTTDTECVSKEFVKYIISWCPSLVVQANSKGETPLHIAARYGHLVAVEMLIEGAKSFPADVESGIGAEKKLVRATNHEDDSALHEAVRYNHIQVVRLLTKEDSDHSYSANKPGETSLYMAVEREYGEAALQILENCKAPAYDGPNGRSALHAAVIREDEEIVVNLLKMEHFKPLIKQADILGWLPIHFAAFFGMCGKPTMASLITSDGKTTSPNLVSLLLEYDVSTAYIKNNEGKTALNLAASQGDVNSMEVILSHCPDSAEIVDNNGQNALHYAATKYYRLSVAQLILRNPSFSNLYNERDIEGNTPLHQLALSLNNLRELIEHPRVDKMAYNNEDRTAYDITLDHHTFSDPELQLQQRRDIHTKLGKFGSTNGMRIIRTVINKDNDEFVEQNKEYDNEEPEVKRAKDSHLVVATLIATVTFAAGFTLPGGTIQEGEHQGTAVLKHSSAFQAFVVTDAIAMVLSTIAVLVHFFLVMAAGKTKRSHFFMAASYLIMLAMASIIIAFVTGTFAMLGVSSGLCIPIIVIGMSFFYPFYILFGKTLD